MPREAGRALRLRSWPSSWLSRRWEKLTARTNPKVETPLLVQIVGSRLFLFNVHLHRLKMAVANLQAKIKLNDGNEIPQLGLGVYEMTDDEAYQAVKWALEAGYRHIDTAEWYENEAACGRAINDFLKESNVPRSEIFYTTKLKTNRSYEATLADLKKSLKTCGLEYIDLYLLHSPIGGVQMRKDCWKACIDGKKAGLTRSIGVSNYGKAHIQEFLDQKVELPTLNQIDLHPFMRHSDIVDICNKVGIVLEAWAPLARGMRFDHPVVTKVAAAHNKSPAQILIRWNLQHGHVPIPKSVSQARIKSNGDVFDFEITADEMKELDALDEYLVTDWDIAHLD